MRRGSPLEGLHRSVRVLSVPGSAFVVPHRLLAGRAPSAAYIMGIDRVVSDMQTPWDTRAVTDKLGATSMRTVRQVLAEKAALPPV